MVFSKHSIKQFATEKRENAAIKIIRLIVDDKGVNSLTYDDFYHSLFGDGERKKESVKFLNNVLQDIKARTDDIIHVRHIRKENLWSAYGYKSNVDGHEIGPDELIKKYQNTKRWTQDAMAGIKERRNNSKKVSPVKKVNPPLPPPGAIESAPEFSITGENPKEMNFELGSIKFQIKMEDLKPSELNIDAGGVKIQFKY